MLCYPFTWHPPSDLYNMVKKSKQQQQQQHAPTEKQRLRAEAKERARRWARDTLNGGKNKATAVRKTKNTISKEEAKARARKWAQERFGEGIDEEEAEDVDTEEDEINSCFQTLNIAAFDERGRNRGRGRRNGKAEQPRRTYYSGKFRGKPSTSSHNSSGSRDRERTEEYSRGRRAGATSMPSSAANPTPNHRANEPPFTKEQAEIVEGVIQASKSGRGSHYRVLKITSRASQHDIKKAYRRLALQVHPDKNLHPMSAEAFKVLGSSYEVLKSERSRARYDRRSSNPTTSTNSSRSRGPGSNSYYDYYGAREDNASSNYGYNNTSYNPFGYTSRDESTRARPSDFGSGFYHSSSPFGHDSNPYEGSRRYY